MKTKFFQFATLAVLASVGLLALGSAEAQAKACSSSFCASSKDNGKNKISVNLSTRITEASHYNVKVAGRGQFETSGQFTLSGSKGDTTYYSVQICKRGGFLEKSRCHGWENFRHTID